MAGGPIRRWMAKRWLRDEDVHEIVREIGRHKPKDVLEQQALVADADALVFVAPVFWMGFPAILKGWVERVFTYGFAYTLDREGWKGNLDGRVPMLTQEKGLILTPTFFTEEEYDKGWREAMDTVLCDWGLKMAGVKEAHHTYFYAVTAASDEQRQEYLQRPTGSEGSSKDCRHRCFPCKAAVLLSSQSNGSVRSPGGSSDFVHRSKSITSTWSSIVW